MIRRCKECVVGSTRPAPHPGPRCASHHRAIKKVRQAAAHEAMVQRVYGLPPGGYAKLLAAQGGKCWICQRATGRAKRLAVDHDHATGTPRGILCSVCNRLLGHVRDDPDMLLRAAQYLLNPPAAHLLL